MHSQRSGAEQVEQIPRIAPGKDPSGLAMSPAEGFLLSRIDGATPWRLLREIGGIPAEEVDRTLERWLEAGLLTVEGAPGELATDPKSENRAASATSAAEKPVSFEPDPAVDLPLDLQREIVDFEGALAERNYFEILGVNREADRRDVKKAYFVLSKKFHPDRYFRREIGRFAGLLEHIFKVVMEAYELLSDPATRSEIESAISWGPPPDTEEATEVEEAPVESGTGYRVPSRMENLRRLRKRFRPPDELLAERRLKARQFFEAAGASVEQKSWLEAAASARLAIAFDPWNADYKTGFVEIQAHVNRERAVALLDEAQDAGATQEAMRLLEEAIHYRPLDPLANARAASVALRMNDLERAAEYADAAAEIEPKEAGHHVLRARVLRRTGDSKEARKALQRAIKLAPDDEEVRAEKKLQMQGASGKAPKKA